MKAVQKPFNLVEAHKNELNKPLNIKSDEKDGDEIDEPISD